MLPLGAVQKQIEELEQRIQFLEQENARAQSKIDSLKRAKFAPVEDPEEENFFPTIGDVVNSGESLAAEEVGTGVRTTELGVMEIDSMCMECEETGTTKLLLTKIPFFQEVILMAFECPHCGERNTQIKPGGRVQDKGIKIIFKLDKLEDFSRQIVKSDSCTLRLVELDFEIPPARGVVSNIEGVLTEVCESLEQTQARRALLEDAESVAAIDVFIAKMRDLLEGNAFPITLILDDPSGNSFIDNPNAPKPDANLRESHYIRTRDQQVQLGLQSASDPGNYKAGSSLAHGLLSKVQSNFANEEVIQIPTHCPQCRAEGTSDNAVVNMPFFKELLVMAFTCEECGFRDTEIKGGGAITTHGRRDTLHCLDPKIDLARDLIKSDTAGVTIPEIEVELTHGSLGGMYTTVEGLVLRMKESIFGNRLFQGDSQEQERTNRFTQLEHQLDEMLAGNLPFTLVLSDPLANSYIYSPYDPPSSDPRLTTESYERSWEEDEELGLHDMLVHQAHEQGEGEETLGVRQSDFVQMESEDAAERVFSKLQKDQPEAHPSHYTQGDD
ncbi:hypothetical protein BASA81_011128 [Batrachochytrium salamandrivorans]|nr:hypothetical protein BASA81_011128 [Batrachochytrium salamandrivorans]